MSRIFTLLFFLCFITNASLASDLPESQEPVLNQEQSTASHEQAITYKEQQGFPVMMLLKALMFLALLGLAGFVVVKKYSGMSSAPEEEKSGITVLDRKVISPRMVGVVVSVSGESFLIIQDKQSHSVTSLGKGNNESS